MAYILEYVSWRMKDIRVRYHKREGLLILYDIYTMYLY